MDYDKLIAPAAAAMRPSGIRKFFDLAAEMPECISLGVGEPDFKTPWAVREAGIESLEHGRTRYTSNAGLKELRAEIARYLDRRMGLKYDPAKEVLVTVGGSEAIDMCIRTLVQPGDEVIIPEPCFVCYEPITTLSGGVPVHVACRQEDEFRLRADALKAAITPKTKLLIMPFPNNPTGAVMEQEDLEAIWGKANGSLLYGAAQDGVDMELLRRIGGFFVLGYFRPPDKDEVRLNEKGEVFGYGLAYCQYPLRAWSPCLHTAIGKCLSQAARTRRNILREGREIALRKREA